MNLQQKYHVFIYSYFNIRNDSNEHELKRTLYLQTPGRKWCRNCSHSNFCIYHEFILFWRPSPLSFLGYIWTPTIYILKRENGNEKAILQEHTKKVNMASFWLVTPCGLIKVERRFAGTYCLHHQGDNSNDLQNGDQFLSDYMTQLPRRFFFRFVALRT
jgi:hypothetical protein